MTLTENQLKLGKDLYAITDWLMEKKGSLMAWADTRERMFRYVAFCFFSGKFAIKWDTGKIEAVVFYWTDHKERIEAKAEENVCQFEWLPSHRGDALFVGDVVGNVKAVGALLQLSYEKFPHLITVPIYTYRKGKLVTLRRSTLERILP